MKTHYITDNSTAQNAVKELSAFGRLCLDTETTGLQPGFAKVRLIQLCDASPEAENRTIYVFDLFKITVLQELKALIESRELLVLHNANFDLQFLYSINIDFNGKIFDTYVAERILRAGFKEKRITPKTNKSYFADVSCSLKAVAERRLDIEVDKEQRLTDWGQDNLTLDQIEYAAKDVDILPRIAGLQLQEIKEEGLLEIYSLESKCIRPVAKMCHRGFNVNIEILKKLKITIEERLENITNEFVESLDQRLPEDEKLPREVDGALKVGKNAKKEFNPGSTAQVTKAFLAANIELPVNQTTGKPTLNKVALSEFDSEDKTLNLYRNRVKVETQLEHVNKLLDNVHPITQRIHSGYNQVGANSGRFTSSGAPAATKTKKKTVFGVNIQQVPRAKEFRQAFIPTPGFKLVICDWAQIELRLGAELIGIPQMTKAFNEGIDLHTLTASLIYKKGIDEVSKEERQDGKTLNFALLYGMGYRKYKTYAAQSGRILTLSEAKIAHTAFHSAYPRLREWHQERANMVREGWTYVRTACGRRRLLSYDDASMMACGNTLIQGTGADILKIAISSFNEHLNDDVHLIAAIHDELVIEVKEELAEKYKKVLEETMIKAAETVLKSVPAEADASIGSSWADK